MSIKIVFIFIAAVWCSGPVYAMGGDDYGNFHHDGSSDTYAIAPERGLREGVQENLRPLLLESTQDNTGGTVIDAIPPMLGDQTPGSKEEEDGILDGMLSDPAVLQDFFMSLFL